MATVTRSFLSAPPTTTSMPRAPSPHARSTRPSTSPSSSPSASTCPTGRKSWGSTSRHSNLYSNCEGKSHRSLTAAFLVSGVWPVESELLCKFAGGLLLTRRCGEKMGISLTVTSVRAELPSRMFQTILVLLLTSTKMAIYQPL